MNCDIDNKIKHIIARELNCDVGEITDDAGWNKSLGWDSLAHIGIITSIETEFALAIPDEKIVSLANINSINQYVIEKGNF